MGDIGQQLLPVAFVGGQLRGHLVEHGSQLAHFIPGFHRHLLLQFPLTDLFRRLGELPQGPGDVPGQEVTHYQPDSGEQEPDPPQGFMVGFHKSPFRRSHHHPAAHASHTHAAAHHAPSHAQSLTAVFSPLLPGQGGGILEILEKVGLHLLVADGNDDQGADQDQQKSAEHHLVPHAVKMHDSSSEFIADAVHRQDVPGIFRIRLDFPPQVPDMGINGPFIPVKGKSMAVFH